MKPHATRLLLGAAVLFVSVESVSLTPFSTAAAQPLHPGISLAPCHVRGLAEEILCGTHEVFEDRQGRQGRRLLIHVAVLPASRRHHQPDPLFMMTGGPGQGARGLAPTAARYFRQVRRQRDIVLVDLRGTGASHALKCPEPDDELASFDDLDAGDMVRRCAAALDADPRLYTHRESLADLDEVRAGLGYSSINLWGGSWGTRAALLYALRYPTRTRSVILDGAVSLTMEFPRSAAADAQAALDRVVADCRMDAGCGAAFPEAEAELDRFLSRFGTEPAPTTLRHPRTNAPATVSLTRGLAMEILRGALYVPRDAATIMFLVRQANQGNLAPLVAQSMRIASFSTDDMALGATLSVLCSEDLPPVMHADFAADANGSTFGSAYADIWRRRCQAWPAGDGLDEGRDAVSDVPALILSGGHDPVTPPLRGEQMSRHFPHHRHLVIPNASHNASFSGCVPDLIGAFIDRADGQALDDTCTRDVTWPPFVVSSAGWRP
jgi:pimeloyl-ACP methyl ester carboxylesterase